ncbi:MAG: cytochrome c oxidase assembly factor CtaG [Ktedonobacteraceae bacterium]
MFDGFSLAWPSSLGVGVILLALVLLYMSGVRRVYLRHKKDAQEPLVTTLQMSMFFAGCAILALLLLTPVDTIARTQLFSVHMAQAVTITTICAPLILGGCPAGLLRPILGVPVLRGLFRLVTAPLVASLLFNASFLLWHIPRPFNYVITNAALYHTMMLWIFVVALLNWWPIIGSLKELRPTGYPVQMLYVILDGQPVDIFAFILVFSGIPLYTHYAIPPQTHLTLFADQAIGGALLLVPGLLDIVIMAPLFFYWFTQLERKARVADLRREQEEEYEEDELGEEERTEA